MTQLESNILKDLRKSRGLTQEQLGILSGMTKSQISKMENGTLGSKETTERLLSAMGFDLEYTIIDKRPTGTGEREIVLDTLRSFKQNNADKYGIESLALFGSMSRNEQNPESDVDILISLKSPSLYLISQIADTLKSVLKRDIDLVSTQSASRPEFRKAIEKDLLYV